MKTLIIRKKGKIIARYSGWYNNFGKLDLTSVLNKIKMKKIQKKYLETEYEYSFEEYTIPLVYIITTNGDITIIKKKDKGYWEIHGISLDIYEGGHWEYGERDESYPFSNSNNEFVNNGFLVTEKKEYLTLSMEIANKISNFFKKKDYKIDALKHKRAQLREALQKNTLYNQYQNIEKDITDLNDYEYE